MTEDRALPRRSVSKLRSNRQTIPNCLIGKESQQVWDGLGSVPIYVRAAKYGRVSVFGQ
jgi:hypothetical protein